MLTWACAFQQRSQQPHRRLPGQVTILEKLKSDPALNDFVLATLAIAVLAPLCVAAVRGCYVFDRWTVEVEFKAGGGNPAPRATGGVRCLTLADDGGRDTEGDRPEAEEMIVRDILDPTT